MAFTEAMGVGVPTTKGGDNMKVMKKIAAAGAAVSSFLLPLAVFAQENIINQGLNLAHPAALGTRDIRETIASIINTALGLLGIIVVVIIIYGGFLWMTAGGNEEKVADAKKWIFGGIIGLIIILASYAIASFVISQLVSATANP